MTFFALCLSLASAASALEPAPLGLILMGPPGSGKGAMSARLSSDFGLAHVSSGDLLRERAKTDPRVAEDILRGRLVPVEVVAEVVEERLAREDARLRGFILDGFPRRLEEAEALLGMSRRLGLRLDALLRLEAPEDELLRRVLARGRPDDTETVFRNRMRDYRALTAPVYGFLASWVPLLAPDVAAPDVEAAYRSVKRAVLSLPRASRP
ncbi:MAG: nucleoside monophosphate kinase [Elusimicrobia bacterium]|nr:nucleoside monophosphate kinase [Elusimicrobiota bacterium]